MIYPKPQYSSPRRESQTRGSKKIDLFIIRHSPGLILRNSKRHCKWHRLRLNKKTTALLLQASRSWIQLTGNLIWKRDQVLETRLARFPCTYSICRTTVGMQGWKQRSSVLTNSRSMMESCDSACRSCFSQTLLSTSEKRAHCIPV